MGNQRPRIQNIDSGRFGECPETDLLPKRLDINLEE
jgi:hypothetical protein